MDELTGKVAVVTGAGSGIGRALAERFATEGMKLVLADVEPDPLHQLAERLAARGVDVVADATDVAQAEDVEALAKHAFEHFGAVHVVCNNAGVGGTAAPAWELSVDDWRWVLGVNLWGVIHGVRAFVPRMLESGQEGHVVNTASIAGLITVPYLAPYAATKHAVVALSESLHLDLKRKKSKLSVSVVCPGFVKTRIASAERNRPPELSGGARPPQDAFAAGFEREIAEGTDPSVIAGAIVDAIRARTFYVLTHGELTGAVKNRMQRILDGEAPAFDGL